MSGDGRLSLGVRARACGPLVYISQRSSLRLTLHDIVHTSTEGLMVNASSFGAGTLGGRIDRTPGGVSRRRAAATLTELRWHQQLPVDGQSAHETSAAISRLVSARLRLVLCRSLLTFLLPHSLRQALPAIPPLPAGDWIAVQRAAEEWAQRQRAEMSESRFLSLEVRPAGPQETLSRPCRRACAYTFSAGGALKRGVGWCSCTVWATRLEL